MLSTPQMEQPRQQSMFSNAGSVPEGRSVPIKNLMLQWLSTTCLKLGDMVDICCSFKIGETVGIHPIVKNCDMVGIRCLIEIGETVGIYRIFKNWHYGGYPPCIENLMIWRVSTPYLKIYNTVCIHSPP